MIDCEDISLTCSDGIQLAGQKWRAVSDGDNSNGSSRTNSNESRQRKILCLHGYMDNCRSFHYLSPYLAHNMWNAEVVAIDFPGHGKSSHKSVDPTIMVLSDLVYYVTEAVDLLSWTTFTLIGHSMGSAVAIMYAAAFPEYVTQLVILDGYAPDPTYARGPSQQLRLHVTHRQGNAGKRNRLYASIADAVATRQRTATISPGSQWLSREAATELVERAIIKIDNIDNQGYAFRHAPDLLCPHIHFLTIAANDGFFRDIQCPTLWLRAKNGWPYRQDWLDRAEKQLLATVKVFDGSHHLHADPDSCEEVAKYILNKLL